MISEFLKSFSSIPIFHWQEEAAASKIEQLTRYLLQNAPKTPSPIYVNGNHSLDRNFSRIYLSKAKPSQEEGFFTPLKVALFALSALGLGAIGYFAACREEPNILEYHYILPPQNSTLRNPIPSPDVSDPKPMVLWKEAPSLFKEKPVFEPFFSHSPLPISMPAQDNTVLVQPSEAPEPQSTILPWVIGVGSAAALGGTILFGNPKNSEKNEPIQTLPVSSPSNSPSPCPPPPLPIQDKPPLTLFIPLESIDHCLEITEASPTIHFGIFCASYPGFSTTEVDKNQLKHFMNMLKRSEQLPEDQAISCRTMFINEEGGLSQEVLEKPLHEILNRCFSETARKSWLEDCLRQVNDEKETTFFIPLKEDSFYDGIWVARDTLSNFLDELLYADKFTWPAIQFKCWYQKKNNRKIYERTIDPLQLLTNWWDQASDEYLQALQISYIANLKASIPDEWLSDARKRLKNMSYKSGKLKLDSPDFKVSCEIEIKLKKLCKILQKFKKSNDLSDLAVPLECRYHYADGATFQSKILAAEVLRIWHEPSLFQPLDLVPENVNPFTWWEDCISKVDPNAESFPIPCETYPGGPVTFIDTSQLLEALNLLREEKTLRGNGNLPIDKTLTCFMWYLKNKDLYSCRYSLPALDVIERCFGIHPFWLKKCRNAVRNSPDDFFYILFEDDCFYTGMKISKLILDQILSQYLESWPEIPLSLNTPVICEYINRNTNEWEKLEIPGIELLKNWRDGASSKYLAEILRKCQAAI